MSNMLELLSAETGLHISEVEKIMITAPVRYKSYFITKRSGGLRKISQPAREVKLLQRAFADTFLSKLKIHPSATAYRKGLSLFDNAKPHAGHRPILKMDLRNFFPSVRGRDWVSYCEESSCLTDPRDVRLATHLLFHKEDGTRLLRLAIGAPTSPMLSNILMFEFDKTIHEYSSSQKVSYTRYADDMTFSAERTGYLTGVVKAVAQTIRHLRYPKLEIHTEKTRLITTKYGRSVTGLVLTNDGSISIGRDRKRQLHAAVFQASKENMSTENLQHLCGMLAYVNSVEPSFIEKLEAKYGEFVIRMIKSAVVRRTQ